MMIYNRYSLISFLIGSVQILSAQNCPEANRFFHARETGRIRANRMDSLAGLATSRLNPGVFWVHNGGSIDRLFALTSEGRPAGTFTLPQPLADAEALSIGPGASPDHDCIYLGDIGDSQRQRRSIVVFRLPEPELSANDSKTRPASGVVSFQLSYPDSGHDAQTLLVDPVLNDLYVVTQEAGQALVFRARQDQLKESSTTLLELIAVVPVGGITDGDISRDGGRIALRSREFAWLWKRNPNESIQEAFSQPPLRLSLEPEQDGSALAFSIGGTGCFTVGRGSDQPIYFYGENRTRFTVGQPLGMVSEPTLLEVSGIAASRRNPGVIWMHNDGTNQTVFALSTNGALRGQLDLKQTVVDMEDIAIGPGDTPGSFALYLADIGDNDESRSNIAVVQVEEPDLLGTVEANLPTGQEKRIVLQYPDEAHDAEALLVDPLSGDIYIATKEETRFRLYCATRSRLVEKQDATLELVQTGNFGQVSAGDVSADGTWIALRREDAARIWRRAPGQTIVQALDGPGETIPIIGPPQEPNGEGLTFFGTDNSYLTFSEGKNQSIYAFQPLNVPQLAAAPIRIEDGWRLLLEGCAGTRVKVQASVDLINWTNSGETVLSEGTTSFEDPTSWAQRFYRLAAP